MTSVQIFGLKSSQATRAAERFFKERRIAIHYVDLAKKPMAPAEIKRFIDRFGLSALLDTESKAYVDGGLKYMKMSEAELLARVERDPKLLRLPLIRGGKHVSVGKDEDTWKLMIDA
jgi:arsenate reductase (glutaredoxin)